jgi:hypothetical protein
MQRIHRDMGIRNGHHDDGSAEPAKVFCQDCRWLEYLGARHMIAGEQRCFHPNALWTADSFLRPGQRYLAAAERNTDNACPDFVPLSWCDIFWRHRVLLLLLAIGAAWYVFYAS